MQRFKPRGTDGVGGGGKQNNLFIDTVVPEIPAVWTKKVFLTEWLKANGLNKCNSLKHSDISVTYEVEVVMVFSLVQTKVD